MRFRDRDAPISSEGLIFRTYGYDHPPGSCFCDLEYAPETIYETADTRATRESGSKKYYKFYFDGGLEYVKENYPKYQLFHKALRRDLVAVTQEEIERVIRPDLCLSKILQKKEDPLIEATKEVLDMILNISVLDLKDFGVFGSLAHQFHNSNYSDIDLIIFGKKELRELGTILEELYDKGSLKNEFENWTMDMPPIHWNFSNYSKREFGKHQKRKLIYAIYKSEGLGRDVKVEFEPVRRWEEIENEYVTTKRIEDLGQVEAVVTVKSDEEAGFMPSIYNVEIEEITKNFEHFDITRIVSYMEEFRLQIQAGETAKVRGNLELVETSHGQIHQITLSYRENYFEQVLKSAHVR